ncbi:MAG TPA: HIT domain-containing protein [Phycisphaeraceae bacterium]
MESRNLWAPWRIGYIQGLAQAAGPAKDQANGCFLCEAARVGLSEEEQAQRLVLLRDDRGILLLNRYPYTNGHLLAAPLEHLPELSDLTADQRSGLIELAELGTRLLKAAVNPQGVNLGMNIGRCAGAGVPGHVHLHVVPRWGGDVNFMDVVAGVRIIPQALEESYRLFKETLARL